MTARDALMMIRKLFISNNHQDHDPSERAALTQRAVLGVGLYTLG